MGKCSMKQNTLEIFVMAIFLIGLVHATGSFILRNINCILPEARGVVFLDEKIMKKNLQK